MDKLRSQSSSSQTHNNNREKEFVLNNRFNPNTNTNKQQVEEMNSDDEKNEEENSDVDKEDETTTTHSLSESEALTNSGREKSQSQYYTPREKKLLKYERKMKKYHYTKEKRRQRNKSRRMSDDSNLSISPTFWRRYPSVPEQLNKVSSDFSKFKYHSVDLTPHHSRNSSNQHLERLLANSDSFTKKFLINSYDNSGYTPLINAIFSNDVQEVKALLDQGADVNFSDQNGNAPLIIAMEKGYADIALLLLNRGANVNVLNRSGNTPLHLSLLNPELKEKVLPVLLNCRDLVINSKNNNNNTPLSLATVSGDRQVVKELLSRGVDVNSLNEALLFACIKGFKDIVMDLLEHGADVNCRDIHRNTPLHLVARWGHVKIVKLLLQRKANMRLKNAENKLPIQVTNSPRIQKLIEDYDPAARAWRWKIRFKHLIINKDQKLGEGRFGVVYRGYLHGTPVAVKVLNTQSKDISNLEYEVGIMSEIHHPNILMFLGAVLDKENRCIVTELCAENLRTRLQQDLSGNQILKYAIHIARGMAWLHSRVPSIIHRDLHSKNILISYSDDCKIADFGLSVIQDSIVHKSCIYERTKPPEETLRQKSYSKKSDVYMFGFVLYELLTRRLASRDNTTEQYFQILRSEYQNCEGFLKFIQIIEECCSNDPNNRPEFEQLIERLESLRNFPDIATQQPPPHTTPKLKAFQFPEEVKVDSKSYVQTTDTQNNTTNTNNNNNNNN